MSLIHDLPKELFASFEAHTLIFKLPSGTSRGILTEKKLWIIQLSSINSAVIGLGECSVIPGLSPDYSDPISYEKRLTEIVSNPLHFLTHPELLANAGDYSLFLSNV